MKLQNSISQTTLFAICKDALKELERLNGSAAVIKRLKIVLTDTK